MIFLSCSLNIAVIFSLYRNKRKQITHYEIYFQRVIDFVTSWVISSDWNIHSHTNYDIIILHTRMKWNKMIFLKTGCSLHFHYYPPCVLFNPLWNVLKLEMYSFSISFLKGVPLSKIFSIAMTDMSVTECPGWLKCAPVAWFNFFVLT